MRVFALVIPSKRWILFICLFMNTAMGIQQDSTSKFEYFWSLNDIYCVMYIIGEVSTSNIWLSKYFTYWIYLSQRECYLCKTTAKSSSNTLSQNFSLWNEKCRFHRMRHSSDTLPNINALFRTALHYFSVIHFCLLLTYTELRYGDGDPWDEVSLRQNTGSPRRILSIALNVSMLFWRRHPTKASSIYNPYVANCWQ